MNDPQFQRRFAIVGSDKSGIERCLSQPLINLFLTDPLLTLVVEQGRLLLFRRLTYIAADQYQAFLAQSYRVAEMLSRTPRGH